MSPSLTRNRRSLSVVSKKVETVGLCALSRPCLRFFVPSQGGSSGSSFRSETLLLQSKNKEEDAKVATETPLKRQNPIVATENLSSIVVVYSLLTHRIVRGPARQPIGLPYPFLSPTRPVLRGA
ncbi:unnamed protein product [Caenorhabditis auriculariae]|uniref:Uncharacterized protein n=1 Tax=Caenorhabditis auriculariae TaxID=2777116 RepID=A0A8S1HBM1_9PELO|nr:unnamed protein product [Caenorhabditis auriculariae]